MQMILIKANRLQLNARHTSKELSDVTAYNRIQDPAAVFANPNHVVLKIVYAVGCFYIFHGGIIPPPGSFIHG
jgi:hypothetical protein